MFSFASKLEDLKRYYYGQLRRFPLLRYDCR